jgi:hypothetical protein
LSESRTGTGSWPVVVIGAGPVGLASAAHLADRGMAFTVLEAGEAARASVLEWGHVHMFSPWAYATARKLLEAGGWRAPEPDGLTTGAERVIVADRIVAATGYRPDHGIAGELRLDLDPVLESARGLAPLIDPNQHSCGTVYSHGVDELSHPEPGFFAVGMKRYGRAPTFLAAAGDEQVRSVVAALAGDWEAARDVRLELPETGVCSATLGVRAITERPGLAPDIRTTSPPRAGIAATPTPRPTRYGRPPSNSGSTRGPRCSWPPSPPTSRSVGKRTAMFAIHLSRSRECLRDRSRADAP